MDYHGRAQCIVVRDNKLLMVKHKLPEDEWYCLPGGGIEPGETPEQAAVRELREECNVSGVIVKKTGEYVDPYDEKNFFYTFQMDISGQTPSLGYDPELTDNPVLAEVRWMALNEISEMDRVFLWASGLISIPQFADEISAWSREIGYPAKAEKLT